MSDALIAPSILSADFGRLADEIRAVSAAGADWIHVDVMDGQFVDTITIGPLIVEAIRPATTLPLDVHLMVREPGHLLPDFAKKGADRITVHVEDRATAKPGDLLDAIRALGKKAGLALNPATPLSAIEPFIGRFDLLLVMTVVPGKGGQPIYDGSMDKVAAARALRERHGANFLIEVDGGIYTTNSREIHDRGADVIVAGSAVFKQPDYRVAIDGLRHGDPQAEAPRPPAGGDGPPALF